jgi:transcriptional regulator with XRE-family HTH domain
MATTKNFADIIKRELESDPSLAIDVEFELFKANVAEEIYAARIKAGLTQKQLADRAGMQQSAIARLEDTDYDGHSLKSLERVAFALGMRIEIHFKDQCAYAETVTSETFNILNIFQDRVYNREWNPTINIENPDASPQEYLVA